jgi:hypothetical protein
LPFSFKLPSFKIPGIPFPPALPAFKLPFELPDLPALPTFDIPSFNFYPYGPPTINVNISIE